MGKNHLKRLVMPTTWTTQEKKRVSLVVRPNPGAHSFDESMPITVIVREILKYANTTREVKAILQNKTVLVDGTRIKDHRFAVGFMDVLSFADVKENYRLSLDKFRKLTLVKVDEKEAKEKLCKIEGKGFYQGKTQLRLSSGRTLIVDKDSYKTGDTLVIGLPDQKIIKHIALEKGATVMLTKGKMMGAVGQVQEIKGNSVTIKSHKETFETLKEYCFVVGKDKPVVTIE